MGVEDITVLCEDVRCFSSEHLSCGQATSVVIGCVITNQARPSS